MLETIAIILIVLWLLGIVSGYTMGNFIYVLLVIAMPISFVLAINYVAAMTAQRRSRALCACPAQREALGMLFLRLQCSASRRYGWTEAGLDMNSSCDRTLP